MTVEEYKKSFIKLFKQMEEEHGEITILQIWHNRISAGNPIECEIKM